MALDWLPIYPDLLPRPRSQATLPQTRSLVGYARLSSYPVLESEEGPGSERVSSYPVLEIEGGLGSARLSNYPTLLMFKGGFDWLPTYPHWFPPRQKAREGYYVLARTAGPFSITQYVVEAWIPISEMEFVNEAETVGLAWVEMRFRAAG